MNPEIFGLRPHQCEEHLGANCIGQLFTFKSERREELPLDLRQGVNNGLFALLTKSSSIKLCCVLCT